MGIKINLATKPASKPRPSFKVLFGLLLLVGALFSIGYFAAPQIAQAKQLQSRAERIFEYDRKHPNALPNTEIMKLSVALGFGDHNGAKILISRLEARL